MTYEYKEFLAHHGIKGQKWGVRRYQNLDGTLINPKGKQKKKIAEADTWRKEESKWLSDDELNRRNARMQRESTYRQNIENRHPVKKEIKAMAKRIFIGTAVAVAIKLMTANYDSLVKTGKTVLASDGFKEALHKNVIDLRRH